MIKKIDWAKVPFGIKVRVEDYFLGKKRFKNRYFVGIFEPTNCLVVSKINKNDKFTGLKVDDYGVCENKRPCEVSIHPSVKIKEEWYIK